MASSSTAVVVIQHPSLDDLHRHVMEVAAEDVDVTQNPSGFIGPPSPTSRYLGEEVFAGGAVDETAVPVMFRCAWGPSRQSRHVLVWLKPSVDVTALAFRLCRILDIPSTPYVVIEPHFKWLQGKRPFRLGMDKGIPNLSNLMHTV